MWQNNIDLRRDTGNYWAASVELTARYKHSGFETRTLVLAAVNLSSADCPLHFQRERTSQPLAHRIIGELYQEVVDGEESSFAIVPLEAAQNCDGTRDIVSDPG